MIQRLFLGFKNMEDVFNVRLPYEFSFCTALFGLVASHLQDPDNTYARKKTKKDYGVLLRDHVKRLEMEAQLI
jgi:hypothetical protein